MTVTAADTAGEVEAGVVRFGAMVAVAMDTARSVAELAEFGTEGWARRRQSCWSVESTQAFDTCLSDGDSSGKKKDSDLWQ